MRLVHRAVEAARHRYSSWLELRLDRKYGIETRGPAAVEHGYGYEPMQPAKFRAMVAAADIDPRHYAFIDFGSGKGRALVLAAEYGFARVIGVEIAPELHEVALQNVAAFRLRRPLAPPMETHCADAADFDLPPGNVFACFYNPFPETVLRAVAGRIERACRERRCGMWIAYRNPVHTNVFDELTAFRRVASNRSFSLYRSHD